MNNKILIAVIAVIIVVAGAVAILTYNNNDNNNDGFRGVIYDGNGGTDSDGETTFRLTSEVVFDRNPFSFKSHALINWNTRADGSGTTYVAGDSISFGSGTVTLYAQWGYAIGAVSINISGALNEDIFLFSENNRGSAVISGKLVENGSRIIVTHDTWTWTYDETTERFNGTAADGRTCEFWIELSDNATGVVVEVEFEYPVYQFNVIGPVDVSIHAIISAAPA